MKGWRITNTTKDFLHFEQIEGAIVNLARELDELNALHAQQAEKPEQDKTIRQEDC